jgi:hypothetical protein
MTVHPGNIRTMAVMAKQRGLITSDQAKDCGLAATRIRSLVRAGEWVAVRRGVYTDAEVWDAADIRERNRMRTRAAMMTMRRSHTASHDSAGHEHGLEILEPDPAWVHVTRSGYTNAWAENGVKVHLARFTPEQSMRIDGIGVLDMARTAVDIAREHGTPYGEVACDSAMRRGVSRAELMAAYEPMTNWRHVTRVRAAVEFADPAAESVLETLGRILVKELGIGEPDPQFPVQLRSGSVVWGDIRVGCHIFETDGKIKLIPVAEGGVATKSPAEVAWAATKRDRDLRDVGLGVSHIVWNDIYGGRVEAIKRLRREYADTVRMFGEELPEHLVRQAAHLRSAPGARGA